MVERDDRKMILSPLDWPHLALPLVNRTHFPDCAVFCPSLTKQEISPDEPITIYLSNIWLDWAKADTKTYENVDALLADGWRVD